MINVFIIGSKGIPANYGGFETFVDKLTEKKKSDFIQYHVSCLTNRNKDDFYYNNSRCFNIVVPEVGSGKAVLYDLLSLKASINYIQKNNLNNSIIYILACRIGPFLPLYKKKLKKLGVKVFVNPDGHEWKRSKWNRIIKKYWKYSERSMVKYTDLVICDSREIENYIKEKYRKYNPKTTFIPYGADISPSKLDDNSSKLQEFYKKFNIKKNNYYLIVGRFVPENNYELIIKEFMASNTQRDLVIISNVEKNRFYDELLSKTKFETDSRVKFVGTIYDQELLKKIRENAYGYIHGHEVGGTNPSLLEALASTKLNLLLDVAFNKEVGGDGALYFNKKPLSLANLINYTDTLTENEIMDYNKKSINRIIEEYTWGKIVSSYENLFLSEHKK